MAGNKALTKSDLIAALKEYGVPTEERVWEISREITYEIVGDAAGKILEGVDRLFTEHNKSVNERFGKLDMKIDSVKSELMDEIDGLKADLSDAPTRKEFEDLKNRVNRYHPVN